MSQYSLFIQPFGYTPDSIRPMLEHVKRVRETAGGDFVHNICIEHVANNKQDPIPWEVLDVIMEYSPAGPRKAMSNLFVGSSNLAYSGPGSKYREGVQNPGFRNDALAVVEDYARTFHERYGANHWYHFYVDFEAVCNWWVEPATREGFKDLLARWQDTYEEIEPGRSMLYAPAYWQLTPPPGMHSAVWDLFSAVRGRSNAQKGINWISFQDMFGRRNDWLNPTAQTTLNWYRLFRDTGLFASVRTTAELFETTATYYGTGDPLEVIDRYAAYDLLGVPMGHNFELRYWYDIERRLGRVPEDPSLPEPPPPPPVEDKPAFQVTQTVRPGDPKWEAVKSLSLAPETLMETTLVELHDE